MSELNRPQFELALTFDDILLVPQFSEITPTEIIPRSLFAQDIYLNAPIISAAMDTVTEHKIARVMAQFGGFGIIHKNLSIQEQAFEVEKVKKFESGMIQDPITLSPDHYLSEAIEIMNKFSISGIPVTVQGRLVGILTHRDLRFETNFNQPIKNLMTKENLITANEGVTLKEAQVILQKYRIEKLPIIGLDGKLKGLVTTKDIEKAVAYPLATKDQQGRLICGAAVGVGLSSIERAAALVAAGADIICVDTAHGHSKNVIETIQSIRALYPDLVICGGNVVTADATAALIDAGADVVKVGVGPGSICTTRVVAGVGMPQISAIMKCSAAAKAKGKTIIADGGIKYSGDIVKALALGAQAVMIGNLLAGADESPGETVLYQGRTYKVYRGMGSLGAMKLGSKDRYGQMDVTEFDKLVPEGIEGKVPYRGHASAIIHQLVGGLKSGMGYVGAKNIDELQKNAQFVQITSQGLRESHVHDVSITKEAPNYHIEK
jgi:IMP dehydrogenase